MARERFKNHKATIVLRCGEFFIVDWRDKNGSGDYAVRYILDIKKGNFIVTGDLGDCVASWFNEVSPKNLKTYINDISYYMSKFQCTSDDYSREWKDVKEDLEAVKQDILEEGYYAKEVEEDFEKMENLLSELDENYGYSEDLITLFEKYCDPWYESGFGDLGKRVDQRIVLWAVGFQMACEQLGI